MVKEEEKRRIRSSKRVDENGIRMMMREWNVFTKETCNIRREGREERRRDAF